MKKYIEYLIPSIITFVIMIIIFKFNNLYPFGTNPLLQVDSDQLYIPTLYKIYDLLHNGGNLFYNDLGLGNSIYGSLIIQGSLFSPLNLLLYFVDRSNIINFFGLFIIIKLCLISFTSYIYVNNKYKKIDYFYKLLFSILYTFNGFIIFNYCNDIWLEFVILFPLLVMYLDKILNNNEEKGYIIILSISLIISFYYSVFFLIFILIYSLVTFYIYKNKDKKRIIFKLGKSTLIALLISSFSSIPLLYQILGSTRFSTKADISLFSNISMKIFHLLFSPLFIILFFKLITKYKEDKSNILKYILLIIFYFIPIIIDPINAQIHGGSYWELPYRYGFIPLFILFDASLYYLSKFYKNRNNKINIIDIFNSTIITLLGVINIILNTMYRKNITYESILLKISKINFIHILIMLLIIYIMYLIAFFLKKKKTMYIMLLLITIYSIFLFGSWTIYYDNEQILSNNAENIIENMKINKDGRYKISYDFHNPYHGYILDVSTLDNWLHIIPKGQKDVYKNLGYYTNKTQIYSSGGTLFTDWLLNFKYNFSLEKSDDNLFKLVDSYNEKYLYIDKNNYKNIFNNIYVNNYKYIYKYNYNTNNGIIFDSLDQNLTYDNKLGIFDYQNRIYKNLFNKKDDIIEYKNYKYTNIANTIRINYEIENDGYLYVYDYSNSIDYININGNKFYNFEDSIKSLGKYNNNLNLIINFKNNRDINFDIGFIRKDKIVSLNSNVKNDDGKYYAYSEGEKYLFLPINNISGLKVYNNNIETETFKYLNNFIA